MPPTAPPLALAIAPLRAQHPAVDPLQNTFREARANYFPRWDRDARWQCRIMTDRQPKHDDGLCVPEEHTIYLARKFLRWDRNQQLGVLIHEICHAVVARPGHDRRWLDRMSRAARKAEQLGDSRLARWLRDEVKRYQTPPDRLAIRATYREIRDFVRETGTIPSFEAMVEEFSRSRSMTSAAFLKRYPRARRIYLTAKPPHARKNPGRSASATVAKNWVLYVLRCKDDSLYCGITNDLPARIAKHNRGQGARYTRGRGPVSLLQSWPAASQSAALKAERAFKSLTRPEKERRIRSRDRDDELSRLLRA